MLPTENGFVGDGLRAVPWILVRRGKIHSICNVPGNRGTARRPFPTDVSLKFATLDIGPPAAERQPGDS